MGFFKRILLGAALLAGMAGYTLAEDSATMVKKGNRLYREKNYEQSKEAYHKALLLSQDSPAINFNLGAAQFKSDDFSQAVGSFEKALVAGDKGVEAKANYNIGNTKFRLGQAKKQQDPDAAAESFKQALNYYRRAIKLDAQDQDAKYNYELVDRQLKMLQQQDQKSQQQQGGRQQEKKEEKKQQGKTGEKDPQEQDKQPPEEKQEEGAGQEEKKQAEKEKNEQQKEQAQEAKEMTPQEARMLLDGYRQEERGWGRLRDEEQGKLEEVKKDW